jgi:cytochrome subunit of sulfide dehydrogenase
MIVRATLAAAVVLGTVDAARPQGSPIQGAPPPGASSCSGCHGAAAPPPVLTGRDPVELVADLDAFRAGTRPATVMDRIAKGFTHEESVAIATWLAAQK